MGKAGKRYYVIFLAFGLFLILIDCFIIDTRVSANQIFSQKDYSEISNHFDVFHGDTSEDDPFINNPIIKANKLFNSIETLTDSVVKVKSYYLMHIWQPPKVSSCSVYYI
jgi:hypothetical protein